MARLIETKDGILIEVESEGYEKVSAGTAEKVQKGLEQIGPLLRKACDTMKDFWKEQTGGIELDAVQIGFGLNFEAEGNAYIARAKAGASVSVTATLKRPAK
jgi:hypothetical protein